MSMESGNDTDRGSRMAVDQEELYAVVHAAVKDAMLEAVGTVFLLGIALLFIAVGVSGFFTSTATTGTVLSVGFVLAGGGLAAYALTGISRLRG